MENQIIYPATEPTWEGFALSFQQEKLIKRFGKHNLGSISASYAITGPLNRENLQRALDEVVAKHEILRTVYQDVMGERSDSLMVIIDPYSVHIDDPNSPDETLVCFDCASSWSASSLTLFTRVSA